MKDTIELLIDLSNANRTIRKQEATIKELQNKISAYKEEMNRKNEKLLWYAQERAKFKEA
jgi:cell shape-determining protein MreC